MHRWRTALPAVLLPALALVTVAAVAPPAGAAPGDWTRISTGTGGIIYQSSLHRTPDGVLHVLYPKTNGGDTATYGHAAIDADGSLAGQDDVLAPGWATLDVSPALIGDGDGLRAVFGGIFDVNPGFWSDGRMYTATAAEDGGVWTLPAEAVGQSHSAYGSYGTAAVELADGTPVAAYPLNSDIVWHVGTGPEADQSYAVGSCCAYSLGMADDNGDVWIGWYQNGSTAATNGTFVKQILPTVGPTMKAPGSSQGTDSLPTGKVALVARTGGGVYAAYCVGYPTCGHIGLWKVGSSQVTTVPSSRYAADIALSPGPSGRIWVAWSDNIPRVRAVRTGVSGSGFGPVRTLGTPPHQDSVYNVSTDGTTGRGDVVINVGNGFWHTQVAPGLTLKASPTTWQHGTKKKVTFTVTDAGDHVGGAKVKVGSRTCTTAAAGTCAITFPAGTPKGTLVGKATHSGYGAGSVRLKVT